MDVFRGYGVNQNYWGQEKLFGHATLSKVKYLLALVENFRLYLLNKLLLVGAISPEDVVSYVGKCLIVS